MATKKKVAKKKVAKKKSAKKKTLPRTNEIQYLKFVKEYLVDFNATRAAIAVGYSERSARTQGARMLANDNVVALLQKEAAKALERVDIKVDKTLNEIKLLAYSNMADYAEWGNGYVTLKDCTEIPRELLACVSEVSQSETKYGTNIRFKLHDKKGSLDTLAKIEGLLKENLNVNTDDTFKQFMEAMSGRSLGPPPLRKE
jgi:phage terminase small subunit